MRRWGIAFGIALILSASSAAAQQPPSSTDGLGPLREGLASVDAQFGKYVVEPLAALIFFDVVFWDHGAEAVQARCEQHGLRTTACNRFAQSSEGERAAICEERGLTSQQCTEITTGVRIPIIVLWLISGALFLTLRFVFINIRAFKHAIKVTAGVYDDPDHPGEVSHFQALSSALSATVGLGNIAGVAVAVGLGGPGAVFWMVVAGFLGMTSKFTECTLGQLYRVVDARGNVLGGPMRYLRQGIGELGGPRSTKFGKVLAVLFSVMCIGGSFGGGNMFQSNQSYAQVATVVPWLDGAAGSLIYGLVLAVLVGVVIIGGIRRIGTVAGYIVPIMCGVYVLAGLWILFTHASEVPAAFATIVREAFAPEAAFGGAMGVLVVGFQRSAFSNEAGVGSASIAHSAAATDEPVREGIVALLEPFIDTIIVCTMTALVVVITGAYQEGGASFSEGIVMTSRAFGTVLPWFPAVLSFAAFMFAFSTMISWSYYGERCWAYLLGPNRSMIYRGLFLFFTVLGAVLELGNVISFSDLMILGMAFPNMLGLVLLSGKVNQALSRYWGRLKSGEMKPVSRRPHL